MRESERDGARVSAGIQRTDKKSSRARAFSRKKLLFIKKGTKNIKMDWRPITFIAAHYTENVYTKHAHNEILGFYSDMWSC